MENRFEKNYYISDSDSDSNESESSTNSSKYGDSLKEDSFVQHIKEKLNTITSTPQDEKDQGYEKDEILIVAEKQKTEEEIPYNSSISSSAEASYSYQDLNNESKEKKETNTERKISINSSIASSSSKIFASPSSVSAYSDKSVIDDSFTNLSRSKLNTSKKIIEESAMESFSNEISCNGINASSKSNDSDIEYIESEEKNASREFVCNISSPEETNENIEITDSSRDSKTEVYEIEDSDDNSDSREDSLPFRNSRDSSQEEPLVIDHSEIDDSRNSSQINSSSFVSERSVLERKIADKTTVYHNILKAVRGCDTKKLKDGGKLLQEKLTKCKEELDELKEQLKLVANESGDSDVVRPKLHSNSIFSTKDQVLANLGKKGLETHRVQAALTVDALMRIHESLSSCPDENTFETDPRGLRVELMPHQRQALAWLLWRERQCPAGGILADDMGLGKTLSIISLMLRSDEYRKQNGTADEQGSVEVIDGVRIYKGKTLVICPASLVGQWEGQIKKHCIPNTFAVVIHHGKTREFQAKRLAAYDVVITTYGLVAEENKSGVDRKRGILFRVQWERVVLDEAHIIRNHNTQKAVAVCDLLATYRWCLTGTPVHNRELDIYSLLKFLRCSPFDDRTVWKRWVDNKSANGVQRLQTVIKSILLRRTKAALTELGELASLPSKKSVPVYIELDDDELKVYQEVLHFSKSLLAEYLHQRDVHVGDGSDQIDKVRRQLKSVEDIKTTEIFVLLLRLRQICCLPGLIHSFLEKETCIESGIEPENPDVEDLYTQMSRLSIGSSPPVREAFNQQKENVLVKSNPVFQINRRSSKIEALLKIIEEILETDDKIVIVSQWANLLRKLEPHIRPLKVGIVTLDGSVPVKFRSKIISDFNEYNSGVRVMLLSLNAGGVGLNLIGGNRLIIFEPHWNPQLESQACDRVYRVGQKKQVYIYKIICRNTIEERIELLQKKKLEMANNILQGMNPALKSQVSQLSLPDLITLFDIGHRN